MISFHKLRIVNKEVINLIEEEDCQIALISKEVTNKTKATNNINANEVNKFIFENNNKEEENENQYNNNMI